MALDLPMTSHPRNPVQPCREAKLPHAFARAALAVVVIASLVVLPSARAADEIAPPLKDSLQPLKNGVAPQISEELWTGYDPRAESLDVEIFQEWEKGGVVPKVLRYRVGVFKGQKTMMNAVYGYKPEEWALCTHKPYDDRWKAPAAATLALEVLADSLNTLVIATGDFLEEASSAN
jgi:hypothetical protein